MSRSIVRDGAFAVNVRTAGVSSGCTPVPPLAGPCAPLRPPAGQCGPGAADEVHPFGVLRFRLAALTLADRILEDEAVAHA